MNAPSSPWAASRTLKLTGALVLALLVPVLLVVFRPGPDAEARAEALVGVWARSEPVKEGDPVRFYYFHPGKDEGGVTTGIGLYRYGRMGLNNTHSYTYRLDQDQLVLTFNKSGRLATSTLRLESDDDGVPVLVLDPDPYEPKPVRYRKQRPPVGDDGAPTATAEEGAEEGALDHPFARMWVHQQRFVTGGMAFAIYQLKPPAIDGRGVGWFHTGDFDNWSTETLIYRRTSTPAGEQLELMFPLRGERHTTLMRVGEAEGRRVLDLVSDPRNFWHHQVYVDGGASFGAGTEGLLGGPVPLDFIGEQER